MHILSYDLIHSHIVLLGTNQVFFVYLSIMSILLHFNPSFLFVQQIGYYPEWNGMIQSITNFTDAQIKRTSVNSETSTEIVCVE